MKAPRERIAKLIARRSHLGRGVEIPQHGVQTLGHVLGDAIEQEGRWPEPSRTALARAQQSAVEQDGGDGRVQNHAGWYAPPPKLTIGRGLESKETLKRYFSVHPLKASFFVMATEKAETDRVPITLALSTITYLEKLVRQGTHGTSVPGVARTLIEEGIRLAIKDGLLSIRDNGKSL
jgi:hypothetical protein